MAAPTRGQRSLLLYTLTCALIELLHGFRLKTFTSVEISQIIEEACFVGLNGDDAGRHGWLQTVGTIFSADNVYFGQLVFDGFKWPGGGGALKFEESHDAKPTLLVIPKIQPDRACLMQPEYKVFPAARAFSGHLSVTNVVSFINTNCGLYRDSDGGLSMQGVHRQYILQNLFHVENVSRTNMGDARAHRSACYSRNSCLKESSIPKCDEIESPSKEQFFHEYLKLSKPVIIKNAARNLTAYNKWTRDFLSRELGRKRVHVKMAPNGQFEGVEPSDLWEDYDTFKIPREVKSKLRFPDLVVVRPATIDTQFSEFLKLIANSTKTNTSAYLEYSSIPQYMPELEPDLASFPFMEGLLNRRHLNIWLSDGNTLGKLHFDPFDNLLCQISGKKQVLMFSPHGNEKLYEAHIPEAMLSYDISTNTFHRRRLLDSTSMVMSPVDVLNPDFKRFPLFRESHLLNCTVENGDVLFMPAFWWHEVQSYPNIEEKRNLAVNYWYQPFFNKDFPCPECRLDVSPAYRHLL